MGANGSDGAESVGELKVRVYCAGPYSNGSESHNVRIALEAAEVLLRRGYEPYVPHLSHFWHLLFPHSYEAWMELDFAFLEVCDALFRLPGESPGADREVEAAKKWGIPVWLSLDDFPPI